MLIHAQGAIVGQLWQALSAPPARTRPDTVADLHRQALADRALDPLEVESLLWALDPHLAPIRVADLFDLADVRPVLFCRRPRAREREVYGRQMVPAIELARLLILLERLGFDTDPATLVAGLAPGLAGRRLLNADELRVWWFARERHRCEAVGIAPSGLLPLGGSDEALTRSNGYRAEVWHGGAGYPAALRVEAPGRRRLPRRAPLRLAA